MKRPESIAEMHLNPDKIHFCLQKNPFMKLSDIVYQILADEILSFRIAPGSKLNISLIAMSLEISRTPVVNAVKKLCDCGLFREEYLGKNKNYFVITTNGKSLTDQFVARKAVETTAASLCAGQVNMLHLPHMRKLAAEYKNLWERYTATKSADILSAIIEADEQFHRLILDSAMNPYLIKMYTCDQERFSYLMIMINDIVARGAGQTDNICLLASQHLLICDAIESGVPKLAAQAMERHLDFCHQRLLLDR